MAQFDLLRPWSAEPGFNVGVLRREMDDLFDRFGSFGPSPATRSARAVQWWQWWNM